MQNRKSQIMSKSNGRPKRQGVMCQRAQRKEQYKKVVGAFSKKAPLAAPSFLVLGKNHGKAAPPTWTKSGLRAVGGWGFAASFIFSTIFLMSLKGIIIYTCYGLRGLRGLREFREQGKKWARHSKPSCRWTPRAPSPLGPLSPRGKNRSLGPTSRSKRTKSIRGGCLWAPKKSCS